MISYDNNINNEFTMTGFSVEEQDLYNKLSSKVARSVTDPNTSDLQIYLALVAIVMTGNGISIEDMYKEIGVQTASDPALRSMAMLVGYRWDNSLPTEYNRTRLMFYMYRRKYRGTIPSIKNLIRSSAGEEEFYSNSLNSSIEVIEGQDVYSTLGRKFSDLVPTTASAPWLVKKTFPIEVFKGGRNLLYGLKAMERTLNGVILTVEGNEIVLNGLCSTSANFVSRLFDVEEGLHTLSVYDNGVAGGTNVQMYNPTTGAITVSLNKINNSGSTIFKTGPIVLRVRIQEGVTYDNFRFKVKLEKGSTPTEYSPSPIDGYGLDLPNGAWHLKVPHTRLHSKLNFRVDPSSSTEFHHSMRIKNFNDSEVFIKSGSEYSYSKQSDYSMISEKLSVDSNESKFEVGSATDLNIVATDLVSDSIKYHGEFIRVVIPDHLLIMRVDIEEVRPAGTVLEFLLKLLQKVLLAKAKVFNDESQYDIIYQAGNYYSEYIYEWGLDNLIGDVFNRPLEMYSLSTAHGEVGLTLRGVMINLIKSDFSDFTPYQGATVEVNKTFPIEVFKGGRNLYIPSPTTRLLSNDNGNYAIQYENLGNGIERVRTVDPYNGALNTYTHFFYDTIVGETYTQQMMVKSPVDIELRLRGGSYTMCKANEWTKLTSIIVAIDTSTRWYGFHNILDKPVPKEVWFEYKEIKITKGDNPNEPYSPSPIDGYGYTGSDGAYHIKTSGGTQSIKYQVVTSGAKNIETSDKVSIYPFENMRVYNGSKQLLPPNNELSVFNDTSTFTFNAQLQFRTVNNVDVDQSLNFIASNPSILISEEDYLKTLGTPSTLEEFEKDIEDITLEEDI